MRMESAAELGEKLRRLRAKIDSLEAEFCRTAREFQRQGGHRADGAPSAVSWLRHNCNMSSTAAADRLCVGKELESLPRMASALAAGEIGYQSASVLCHLRDQLGEKRELFVEDEMLGLGAGPRARTCATSVSTPVMSPTPTASSNTPRRTSAGAGSRSARWPTACMSSTACST